MLILLTQNWSLSFIHWFKKSFDLETTPRSLKVEVCSYPKLCHIAQFVLTTFVLRTFQLDYTLTTFGLSTSFVYSKFLQSFIFILETLAFDLMLLCFNIYI